MKKQILIFIGGFIAGGFTLFIVLYIIGTSSNYVERELNENPIQYIEVKSKKGIIKLHTGMSKDSVQILLGKSDEVKLHTIHNSTYETWGYKVVNKYNLPKDRWRADLEIEFRNGKLDGVRQD